MYTYPKLSRGMSGNDGNDGSGDDKRDDKPHDTQQSSFVYWILGGLAFFVLGGLAALLRALINVARSQRLVPPPPAQGDTTQKNPTGPTQPGSSSSPGSSSPGSSSTGRKREVAGQPKPKTTLKDLDHEEHASLSTIPESLTSHAAPIATPELSLSDKEPEDGDDKVEDDKVEDDKVEDDKVEDDKVEEEKVEDDKPKDDSDEGTDGDGDQHESHSTTPPAPVSDELEKTNSPSKDHSLEISHESNQTGETVKVDEDHVNRSTEETEKPTTTITSPQKSESSKAAKTEDDDSNDEDKSQTEKDTNEQESSH